MNLSMNVQSTPTPSSGPPAVVIALDAAQMLDQALPFEQVIAADAALPAPDAALPGAPTDAEAPDIAVEPAAPPDVLLAAMAPPVAAVALPAMMMAMPATKPVAGQPAPAPALAPVAARVQPDAAPLPQPLAARVDKAPAIETPLPDTATADTPGPGIAGSGAQPPATASATTERLQLASPPSAWRQTLQAALGERLQLQLGRGAEQATIRLEPPQLGRIDIAIRHSGGNLEVNIAASNGDVLRQLNLVSDSLRSDLAGRQYASVAVNVTASVAEAPRAQAGHQPSAQPDAQGRQHEQQQQQQQRRTPGLALNDAGAADSLFSLNGRE